MIICTECKKGHVEESVRAWFNPNTGELTLEEGSIGEGEWLCYACKDIVNVEEIPDPPISRKEINQE